MLFFASNKIAEVKLLVVVPFLYSQVALMQYYYFRLDCVDHYPIHFHVSFKEWSELWFWVFSHWY